MCSVKKRDVELLILFLLYPLLSIPFVLKSAKKGNILGLFLLCNLFALIGFLIVPSYDVVNHGTWAYRCYSTGSFWLHYAESTDVFLPTLSYLLLTFGLSFHYVTYIFTIIASIAFWSVYYELLKGGHKYNTSKIFYISLLFFPFFGVITGLRFYTASCLLIRAIYDIFVSKQKFRGIMLLIVSPLIHFSMIAFVLVVFVALFIRLRINRICTFILFLFLCFSSILIVEYLVPYLEMSFNEDKVSQYSDSENLDYLEGQNINFLIVYYLGKLCSIPIMLYLFYKCYNLFCKERLLSVFVLFLYLYAISFEYVVMSGRFGAFAYLVFYLLMTKILLYNSIPMQQYKILLFSKLFGYMLSVWNLKDYFFMSNHLINLLYMPFPILLCNPYNERDYFNFYEIIVAPYV